MPYKQVSIIRKYWKNQKPPVGFQINWSHPLARGLVGCWLFNEGGGNKVYDLAKNNHGTLINRPLWWTGRNGYALKFDGVNDYVDAGSGASLNITDAITVSAWIKPFSTHDGGVIEKTIGGTVNKQYLMFVSGSELLNFRVMKAAGIYDARSASYPPLNTWTHIVGRYDGSEVSVWVNGIKQITTVAAAAPIDSGSGATLIGMLGSSIYPFNGLIDEVRVYNRALSSSEIKQLYQDPYCFIQPIVRRFYSITSAVQANKPTRRRVLLSCN